MILPYNPKLDYALKGIHGGVYATLLYTAGWFTSAASRDDNRLTTSEKSIHFLRPTSSTIFRAVGQIVKSGERQDIVEMRPFDGKDHLVGHAIGTFVVLPNMPPPKA